MTDLRPAWMRSLRKLIASTPSPPDPDRVQPTFGTVRSLNPLRIALDSDPTYTLPYAPPALDYPTFVGQRVWVQTYGRRVVIVGVSKSAPDLPVGTVSVWAGMESVAPPMPWMVMERQALLRTEYPELFGIIGTTFGAPDSSRFYLPETRGKVIAGRHDLGEAEFDTIGKIFGTIQETLTVDQMPSHGHYAPNGSWMFYVEGTDGNMRRSNQIITAGSSGEPGTWRQRLAETTGLTRLPTASAGGGQPHNNVQPTLTLRWMLKVR